MFWIYFSVILISPFQIIAYLFGLETGATISSNLDGILGVILVFFMLTLTQLYESNNWNNPMITVFTVLGTLSVVGIVQTQNITLDESLSNLLTYMFIPYFLLGGLQIFRTIKRMSGYMQGKQLEIMKYINYFIIIGVFGISLFYASFTVFAGFETAIVEEIYYFTQAVIPPVLFIVSFSFIYRSFIHPQNPALLTPQRNEKFILMSKQGTPVYEYDFKDKGQIDGVLLSGALSAISAVLQEATQVVGTLESIKLGQNYLIIEAKSELIGILFAEVSTSFLYDALKKTMSDVSEMGLDIVNIGNDQETKLKHLVEYNFGLK